MCEAIQLCCRDAVGGARSRLSVCPPLRVRAQVQPWPQPHLCGGGAGARAGLLGRARWLACRSAHCEPSCYCVRNSSFCHPRLSCCTAFPPARSLTRPTPRAVTPPAGPPACRTSCAASAPSRRSPVTPGRCTWPTKSSTTGARYSVSLHLPTLSFCSCPAHPPPPAALVPHYEGIRVNLVCLVG